MNMDARLENRENKVSASAEHSSRPAKFSLRDFDKVDFEKPANELDLPIREMIVHQKKSCQHFMPMKGGRGVRRMTVHMRGPKQDIFDATVGRSGNLSWYRNGIQAQL